jgi:putative PEP-CTERM system histidine kinase
MPAVLPFAAACCCLLLAIVGVARRGHTVAGRCFAAGMLLLGVDSLLIGLAVLGGDPASAGRWLSRSMVAKSFLPVIWLPFSLTYSRGGERGFLSRWRPVLIVFALLPMVTLLVSSDLFEIVRSSGPGAEWVLRLTAAGKAINAVLIVAFVLIVMNLEQTFRSAVGTMRWRIKFVAVAVGVMFGTSTYARSQTLLYSEQDLALALLEAAGLLVGCACLAIAYARTGLADADVHPSRAVLRSSLTIIVVGGYLFVIGVVAQLVKRFGGAEIFQFQSMVVLLGITGLVVVLLSDRARQFVEAFTARHFAKAQHDSPRVWSLFSRGLTAVKDEDGLAAVTARLVSETFQALSVTVWLRGEDSRQLLVGASTSGRRHEPEPTSDDIATALDGRSAPFDLDRIDEAWADEFRALNPTAFPEGANRLCVPLRSGDHGLGAIVLADRVNDAAYTAEDIELLRCIADQIGSVLMNVRLAGEVARARELDAFRTMSTFFVHDLKNAAASLNLTLENLPVHFDDAAFREDALRGLRATARRIEATIARLTSLRDRSDFSPVEADLNELVREAVDGITRPGDVDLQQQLEPVPPILADREQVRSVVTNLVLNAREALGPGGCVQIRTQRSESGVVLSIADNGCGMSPAFVRTGLFRPFRSTKKQGLGIGLFQSQAIVRAHGGGIHVESEPGRGTTFRVSFPLRGRNDQAGAPAR